MSKYICNKCGCGKCVLTVEDDASIPKWCSYDVSQNVNWELNES